MDFIMYKLKVRIDDVLMVIKCQLNKLAAYVPCAKQVMVENVAQLFFLQLGTILGVLLNIVGDCGLLFKFNFDNMWCDEQRYDSL